MNIAIAEMRRDNKMLLCKGLILLLLLSTISALAPPTASKNNDAEALANMSHEEEDRDECSRMTLLHHLVIRAEYGEVAAFRKLETLGSSEDSEFSGTLTVYLQKWI